MDPEHLRRFSRFRFCDDDELRRVAATVRALRLPPQRRVRPLALPPTVCLYLVRGEVRRMDHRGRVQTVNHRARCAAEPILDQRFPQLTTTTRVRLLQVGESDDSEGPLPTPTLAEPGDAAFDAWLERAVARLLLDELTPVALQRMFRGWLPLAVESGEAVVRRGEPAETFFVVRTGSVRIMRAGETLHTVRPGGFFGEDGLLGRSLRNADAIAAEPSVVLCLPADLFGELLARAPGRQRRFAAHLARSRAG